MKLKWYTRKYLTQKKAVVNKEKTKNDNTCKKLKIKNNLCL